MKDILDVWIHENGTAVLLSPSTFDVLQIDEQQPKTVPVKEYHSLPCIAITGTSSLLPERGILYQNLLPCVFVASADSVSSWSLSESDYIVKSVLRIKEEEGISRSKKGKLRVTPSSSALSYSIANVVHIIALSNGCGLALYKSFKQETNVLDSRLVTLGNDDEPVVLINLDERFEVLIWDVREHKCIHKLFINSSIYPGEFPYDPLVTMQLQQSHEDCLVGHFAYIRNAELIIMNFQVAYTKNLSITNIALDNPILICQMRGCNSIALSFINAQNRLCIVVTDRDICIIDCLQKHIVKKIGFPIFGLHDRIDSQVLMKASIQFPFIGIASHSFQQPLFRHKLDSVFGLVGPIGTSATEVESTDCNVKSTKYLPLLMDDATKKIWIECLNQETNRRSSSVMQKKDMNKQALEKYVKSSGYGILRPKMKLGSAPSLIEQAHMKQSLKAKKARRRMEEVKSKIIYPMTCDLLDCHQAQHDGNQMETLLPPVSALSFSPYGEYLATSHNNATLHVFKLPFSKYNPASYQISETHPCSVEDKSVQSSCRPSWSINNTAHGKKYLAHHNKIYCLSESGKSMSIACELEKDKTNATFFSKDVCILSIKANQIYLHRLSYDRDDRVKTSSTISTNPLYENKSGKSTSSFMFDSQRIQSTTSVNGSMANLVACSCSDKTLQILDVVQNKILWSKNDCAGSRPAHSIAFPQPSKHCPLASENYNLLITASTDNGGLLSLFDLRCGDVVKMFRGHTNRKDLCIASFSPCVRYVSIGGEGLCGTASLYDLRGTSCNPMSTQLGYDCQQNNPFRDGSVTDCQFNPIHPQLVTGSLSGKLRWYTERSSSLVPN